VYSFGEYPCYFTIGNRKDKEISNCGYIGRIVGVPINMVCFLFGGITCLGLYHILFDIFCPDFREDLFGERFDIFEMEPVYSRCISKVSDSHSGILIFADAYFSLK
jgi:hypothetical protein